MIPLGWGARDASCVILALVNVVSCGVAILLIY